VAASLVAGLTFQVHMLTVEVICRRIDRELDG
jgi:hypothetical protein